MNFYYLNANQETVGPVTEDDLPLLYENNHVDEETLVAFEGGDEWFPLKTIIEVEAAPSLAGPKPDVAPHLQNSAPTPAPVARRATAPSSPAAARVQRPSATRNPLPQQRQAGVYRPAVVPVFDPSRMLGIGRLAYLGINLGAGVLLLVVLTLLAGGALLSSSNQNREGAMGFIIGFVITYGAGLFCLLFVFIATSYYRAKNIGWSPWLTALACLLLFPLNFFIGMLLQCMPTGYKFTRKLDATAKVLGSFFILVTLAITGLVAASFWQTSRPVWPDRDTHVTQLTKHGPSPQPYENEEPPEGVQVVTYPSGNLQLKAWFAKSRNPGKQPTLIYYHGGFAFGADDFEVVRSFLDAGFAVMTPMLRGENGNPGDHEHFYGERDDAEAAILWAKQQPEVDPNRIITFGHSAGGVMSAMVSFRLENAVLLTGSVGGLYDWSIFREVSKEEVPFSLSNRLECRLRAPAEHAGYIQIPHIAYIGDDDELAVRGAKVAKHAAAKTEAPLTIVNLKGDHSESLEPAVEAFLTLAKSKTGL